MNLIRAVLRPALFWLAGASLALAQAQYGGHPHPPSQGGYRPAPTEAEIRLLERRVEMLERLYQEAHGAQATLPPPVTAPGGYRSRENAFYHTISRGETLHGISRLYGVTVKDLAEANGISLYSPIYAGTELVIPRQSMSPGPVQGGRNSSPEHGRYGGVVDGTAHSNRPVSGSWTGSYVVRAGDTLSSISRSHGTTAVELAERNQIYDWNRIAVGQTLLVPGGSGRTSSGSGRQGGATRKEQQTHAGIEETYHYYDVVTGDTITSISRMFFTTPQEVLKLNNLSPGTTLHPGQQIIVPTRRYFEDLRKKGIVAS